MVTGNLSLTPMSPSVQLMSPLMIWDHLSSDHVSFRDTRFIPKLSEELLRTVHSFGCNPASSSCVFVALSLSDNLVSSRLLGATASCRLSKSRRGYCPLSYQDWNLRIQHWTTQELSKTRHFVEIRKPPPQSFEYPYHSSLNHVSLSQGLKGFKCKIDNFINEYKV